MPDTTPFASLNAVLRPVAEANGLPNAHYTSPEVYDAERHALLYAQWAGIGFASDVAAGEAAPIDFAGTPLVAVRDREGTLRVFQNVCRHRGMILVAERTKVGGALRCPYHSWCYGADGRLVATPHVGGPGQNTCDGIDRARLGLIEVRSAVWRDVIFVNIDGTAPEFADYSTAACDRWAEFEEAALFAGGEDSSFGFDVACNWKLAVENYCESYHLPWIHPGLNSYSRLEDHYHIEEPGAFSGQGTRVYRPMLTGDGRRFPDFPGLSDKWEAGAEYIALYPNVLMGVHRDHALALVLLPQGPGRTVEQVKLAYASLEAAQGEDWADMRAKNTAMWHEVLAEDLFVVEGMQRGRAAPGFDGGRFSGAMDGPTHQFHAWAAKALGAKA